MHDDAMRLKQIDARFWSSLAVTVQGQVVNFKDDSLVPAGLIDMVQVAAGADHSLALTRDGRVVAWGKNDNGQCNVPVGLVDVVQVAAGAYHSLAVTAQGQVVAWGKNDEGQSNVPVELVNVVQVAVGSSHALALKRDGRVVAWGKNDNGQCNAPVGLVDGVQVAAGLHSLALTRDGRVVAWGEVLARCASRVAQITVSFHALALKRDGTVAAWGRDKDGECDVPAGLRDVVQVVATTGISFAITRAGRVVAWYENTYVHARFSPMQEVAGRWHTLALTADRNVVAWGRNAEGQCDVPAGLDNVKEIFAGDAYSLAIITSDTAVAWGIYTLRVLYSNGIQYGLWMM